MIMTMNRVTNRNVATQFLPLWTGKRAAIVHPAVSYRLAQLDQIYPRPLPLKRSPTRGKANK